MKRKVNSIRKHKMTMMLNACQSTEIGHNISSISEKSFKLDEDILMMPLIEYPTLWEDVDKVKPSKELTQ